MKNPVVISGYRDLRSLFKAFAEGHLPFVVLLATPGLGKSWNLERMLRRKGCLFLGGGSMSAYGTYVAIAANRDKPIILDDADTLLGSMDGKVILRALTETRSTKTVRWTKKATGAVPPEIETKSAVMLIINDLAATERAIPAILSRALFRTFKPNFEEARREVARWFHDQEIFDVWSALIPWLAKAGPPDMRLLRLAAAAKEGGIDWREDLLAATALGDDDRELVRLLLDRPDRRHGWKMRLHRALTAQGVEMPQSTFFRRLDELVAEMPVARRIRVRGKAPEGENLGSSSARPQPVDREKLGATTSSQILTQKPVLTVVG
jgi:hypothetical protein